jgi:hypothetical protein
MNCSECIRLREAGVQDHCTACCNRRADEEKRRRQRIAVRKLKLTSPRLMTLKDRELRLTCWADGECWTTGDEIPLPTDSKKIRRFRRALKKLKRAIRREEIRIGTLHYDYKKIVALERSLGLAGPFDEEAARRYRAEQENYLQQMSQTPEGRATLEAWDRWERQQDLIYGVWRPAIRDAQIKTEAAHA